MSRFSAKLDEVKRLLDDPALLETLFAGARDFSNPFRALVAEMGGTVFSEMPSAESGYGIATGGRIIHEMGVTRMGNAPGSSALNAQCQAHDMKNLFVADGGPFVSQADKNPTWTIMALAWRTADYITEQRKAGAL